MALKERARAKWNEWKHKLQDKENRRRVEEEIQKRLKQGKEAIDRIEKELRDPENRARAENKIRDARKKLAALKVEFNKKRNQTVVFTKENPEKALVVAAAAGALAGAVWVALRRKK
jgi:ElaB/YqjD/DUF883 family membrane-anchored ribosome-binding protein